MADFKEFRDKVNEQLGKMIKENDCLLVTDVGKDIMWGQYLMSFPHDSNPIFRERTVHDCQCCKSFIKACGNVVIIRPGLTIESIWDIEIDGYYQTVADAMSKMVKACPITGVFTHFQSLLGTKQNHEMKEDEKIRRWDHFYFNLPNKFVHNGAGNPHGSSKESKELLQRSLELITDEAMNTVIELITQGSIYRGNEFLEIVKAFKRLKKTFLELHNSDELYLWRILKESGSLGGIKNTMIGTLLVDLSEEMELDKAVARYESKAAPENYKRPTALITKGMIEKAQRKIEELGYIDALPRRHSTIDDITINNVLFANRDTKKTMNVFDGMISEIQVKKLGKIEEVSVDTFVNDILPTSTDVELYFEGRHQNNLMSLVSPVIQDSKNMFKWGNNFSWAYNGEVADSIKERVRVAGGRVDGVLRCSLSWFNGDDLDIHISEPGRRGSHIYFGNKKQRHPSSGMLDVDMNAGGPSSRKPVENIIYTDKNKMPEGTYMVNVVQYTRREDLDFGFVLELEYEGKIHTFRYDQKQRSGESVDAIEFSFSKKDGIKIIRSIKSDDTGKEVWGINTMRFHKVKMIMNSPNHWDEEQTGNKHLFFILEGCNTEDKIRGFFNEFLDEQLTEHRKVFEVLGSKMMVPESNNQLSGLGFSSTRRNSVICKVTGAFTRTLKISF